MVNEDIKKKIIKAYKEAIKSRYTLVELTIKEKDDKLEHKLEFWCYNIADSKKAIEIFKELVEIQKNKVVEFLKKILNEKVEIKIHEKLDFSKIAPIEMFCDVLVVDKDTNKTLMTIHLLEIDWRCDKKEVYVYLKNGDYNMLVNWMAVY